MAIEDLRQRDWVLLPGTLCTGEVFGGFLDALGVAPERRKTIVLRYPSIAEYGDVLASCANDAIVCGFSLGAIVAAHHTDKLCAARVILFGLNPFPDDSAVAQKRRELARDVVIRGGASALASRLPPFLGPNPDRASALVLAMAKAAGSEIEAQTNLALTRPGAMAALSRTQSPVFVLTGSEDQMAPEVKGMAAADASPNGRFRLLPHLGHYALVEEPAVCAEAVFDMERTFGHTH